MGDRPVFRLSAHAPAAEVESLFEQSGGQHEQEAERVADSVMRPHDTRPTHAPAPGSAQTGRAGGRVQMKVSQAGGAPKAAAPGVVQNVLSSPGRPLDAGARAFMESRFGRDFGGVRVHADGQAAESARAVNALAYTSGDDVVFGAGQYQPGTDSGRRLLAHELAHVAQQDGASAGRIQRFRVPTPFINSRPLTGIEIVPTATLTFAGGRAVTGRFTEDGGRACRFPLSSGDTATLVLRAQVHIRQENASGLEVRSQTYTSTFDVTLGGAGLQVNGPSGARLSPASPANNTWLALSSITRNTGAGPNIAELSFLFTTTGGSFTISAPVVLGSSRNYPGFNFLENVRVIFTLPAPTPTPPSFFVQADPFPVFFEDERQTRLRTGEVDALRVWWFSLPEFVRRSVAAGSSNLYIDGYASGSGTQATNDVVAMARAQDVERHLRLWAGGARAALIPLGHSSEGAVGRTRWRDRRATVWLWVPNTWRPTITRSIPLD